MLIEEKATKWNLKANMADLEFYHLNYLRKQLF